MKVKMDEWYKKLIVLGLGCLISGCVNLDDAKVKYEKRSVNFNLPEGRYTNEMLVNDFGNGYFPKNRGFAEIKDSVCKITFRKGLKVHNTGIASQPIIIPGDSYTMEYKIKYDPDFEEGLHGKQFGFGIGKVYNGGEGEEARANGDGGSVRLGFDATKDSISNRLYVYYCKMKGKYGNNPGDQKFSFAKGVWNTIRLKVTMQSAINKADGRIEVWCNGVKKIDVDDLLFVRKESARKITKLAFSSFPGGGGIYPKHDNFLYIDDFRWSN
ncbi:polysaccharide lyase [Gaetbulibacter sp. M240]|uniref:polysaccharide lyase n=1 Tax=Gaetbulibacter sp. M240 TaxID=3126511 RepID=UPI00374EDC46